LGKAAPHERVVLSRDTLTPIQNRQREVQLQQWDENVETGEPPIHTRRWEDGAERTTDVKERGSRVGSRRVRRILRKTCSEEEAT
jgi:hypothetical protein